MFSIFRRRKIAENDLGILKTDMHSHVLPGIDDGSPDSETSLELIQGLKDLGYSKLIASPHILWDMFKNDDRTIGYALEEGRKVLQEYHVEVELNAAAEYYMDEHFDDLVRTETPLRCIKDNLVLVEFSFVSPPLGLKEKLFDLQVRGYQPIIAHPERYLYFAENKSWYDEIVHAGCYLQINLLSLAGYYGKGALELAKYIYKKKLVHFLGTDLHHHRHLHALRHAPGLMDHVKEVLDTGKIKNMEL